MKPHARLSRQVPAATYRVVTQVDSVCCAPHRCTKPQSKFRLPIHGSHNSSTTHRTKYGEARGAGCAREAADWWINLLQISHHQPSRTATVLEPSYVPSHYQQSASQLTNLVTPSPLSTRTNTNQVTPPVNKSASFDQQRQHDQPPRHDQQPSYTWADAHTVMIIYHWHKDAQETLLGDPVAGFEPGDAKTLRLERAEQRNCGLCEKQYLAYEGMVPLPCGCWFHQKCIKPRLAEWFGCPECGVEMVWVLGVSR